MLRYKFTDSFSSLRRKPGCNECKKFNACYKSTIRKRSELGVCTEGLFLYKDYEDITTDNAEWYLFQIMRDVQLFKNIIETSDPNNGSKHSFTWIEKDVCKLTMDVYLHFILDTSKDVEVDKKQIMYDIYELNKKLSDVTNTKQKIKLDNEILKLTNKIVAIDASISLFVKSIIDTRLKIENNKLLLFTYNEKLVQLLKKKMSENNFVYEEVKKIEDTSKWWVPITRGS